jgi:hypothetical protein
MKRRPLRRAVFDRCRERSQTRTLRLESLESRTLLSGAPPGYVAGPEFRVNGTTAGNQTFEQFNAQYVAMDADGDAVVVWVSDRDDGSGDGVFAQRYAADGTPVGGQFQVNLFAQGDQSNASVAMDADGDFVVTWSSENQDGSDWGIYARRYSANGTPSGGEFRVNQTSAGYQRLSSVAIDAQGNFIVAWTQRPSVARVCPCEIMARRFDSDAVPLGDEFQINEPSSDFVAQPRVAVNGRGEYAVVWLRSQGAGTEDVYARTFAVDGTPLSGEFRVHQYSGNQQIRPSVSISAIGEVVISWQNQAQNLPPPAPPVFEPQHVYLRRFSLNGMPLGDDIRVNSTPAPEHRNATTAMSPNGNFIIAWAGKNAAIPESELFEILQQAYDADGLPVGEESRINVTTANQQIFASIAMDADGDYLAVWTSVGQDGDGYGIYARQYSRGMDDSPPVVGSVFVASDSHAIRDREVLVQHPERLVVTFSEAIDAPPGNARQQWRLLRNGADESDQMAAVTYVFNGATNRHEATLDFQAPLPPGDYELIALSMIRDLSGKMLDGDYDAVGGEPFTRRFTIASPEPAGGQLTIATGALLTDDGAPGTVAIDAHGNFVVVWSATGVGRDIFAQRYDRDGNSVGPVIEVNTLRSGDQDQPTVAMADDGGFAVVWTSLKELGSSDPDNEDIYLQRFNSQGDRLGAVEQRVNISDAAVSPPFLQQRPTIAMGSSGEFVVAWESSAHPAGSGVDIRFQRFYADGSRNGAESLANVRTQDTQRFPHAAMDEYGNFVLTWTSRNQDGSSPISDGVYARRYSAAQGAFLGNEFPVHVDVAGDQRKSTVAIDDAGNFVIAWQSGAEGAEDIFARRYAARTDGALSTEYPLGAPFLVNTPGARARQRPVVAMDQDGDFVVAWQSFDAARLNDTKFRRYAWNGAPQTDELGVADLGPATEQTLAQVAADGQGNFLLAWHAQETPIAGIFAQRFAGFVNSPPVADAGGPYVIHEGENLALDAAGSVDVDAGQAAQLRYDWDLDGDGAFDDLVAVGATATAPWSTLAALGIVDDGQYPISVRVTDLLGGVSVDSATLSLSNAEPSQFVLTAGDPIDEGNQGTVTGSFFDPGASDEHQLLIDWGDGTVEALSVPVGLQRFSFTHLYVDDNLADSFRITARVIDDDEGMSEQAETFQAVANLAPFSLAVQLGAAREGETFTVVGSFLDAGTADVHEVYVDWGEGENLEKLPAGAVVGRQFTATHVYRNNRNGVAIRFQVHDDDGGSGQTTRSVSVANASPANVSLTLAASIVAVDGLVQLSGTFTDTGLDDPHIVDVFWGDGSLQSIPLTAGARSFAATYRYPLPKVYVISVNVSDEMDDLATDTTTVQVICGVPGDTNADCKVNVADMNAVRNNFGSNGTLGIPGDSYPYDGVVNVNDLNQVRNHFGATAPAPLMSQASLETIRIDKPTTGVSRQALDAVFARWSNPDEPGTLSSGASVFARGSLRRKSAIGSR